MMPTNYTQLPNIAREHMLKKGLVHAAMVLDALYLTNARLHMEYTIADLVEMLAPLGLSEKVIRSGTKCALFRQGRLKTAGRDAITYKLPSQVQVLHWFMLYDASEYSDILPITAFAGARAYRRALHLAMIERLSKHNGGRFKMARRSMAARLNVCINTVRNYEKNSPIEVIHNITCTQLVSGMFWNLPSANTFDHSQWLEIRSITGETRRYPLIRAIAAAAINAGCMVWHMRQHSNWYSWAGEYSNKFIE